MKIFFLSLFFVPGFSLCAMEPAYLECWQKMVEDFYVAPSQEEMNYYLRESARHGDLTQAQAWVAAGAQLNSQDHCGETALIQAACYDHEEVCSWLVSMGVDITLKDTTNTTALHEAARNGNERICELLVRHQKRVNRQLNVLLNEKNNYGLRPCDFRDFFCLNPDNLTPEKQAKRQVKLNKKLLRANNVQDVQHMIALGAEIDARDKKGRTILIRALKDCWSDEQLILLLVAGANPNAVDNDGCPPLIWAMKDAIGSDFIKVLIAAGADVNAVSNCRKTALMYAFLGSHYMQKLKTLLEHGALVVLKDRNQETALMYAASLELEDACRLLVDHQARLEASVITFLLWLKTRPNLYMRNLYHARSKLWWPHLGHYALKPLLAARNAEGQTAYDKLKCEFLNFE